MRHWLPSLAAGSSRVSIQRRTVFSETRTRAATSLMVNNSVVVSRAAARARGVRSVFIGVIRKRGGRGICYRLGHELRRCLTCKQTGKEVIAFIVSVNGAEIGKEKLDALCLDHIARFKRPKEYRFIAALPKNNYGKVLKTKLRSLLAAEQENG